MIDLLVQLVVAAAVLAVVVLLVMALGRRPSLRERIPRPVPRRHWWKRMRNG